MSVFRTFGIALIALVVAMLLVACGGGGGSAPDSGSGSVSGRGGVTLSIRWPETQTRLIPTLTESVRVQLVPVKPEGSAPLEDRLIVRDAGASEQKVVFKDLPSVAVKLRVWAYPDAAGQGTPVAAGEREIEIREGHYDQHGITLDSTIERVEVKPRNATPKVDETTEILVEAFDAEGRMVLTPDTGWVFSLDDPAKADLVVTDDTVTLTPIRAGEIRVYAEEKESGVSGEVTLNGKAWVKVQPEVGQLAPNGRLQFTAEVRGEPNATVRWTADGGAITVDGEYLAGSTPGTYTVRAESSTDSSIFGTATVAISQAADVEGWWLGDIEGNPNQKILLKVTKQGGMIAWNTYRADNVPTTPPNPNLLNVFWSRITDTEFYVHRQYDWTLYRLHGTFDRGVMRGDYDVMGRYDQDFRNLWRFTAVPHFR